LRPLSWLGPSDLSKTIRGPQLQKLRNRRRAVALKVVVGVGADQHALFHDLVIKINPIAQFRVAINDCLIPRHRLCFDLLPVAKPADVRPGRRNRIELKFCGFGIQDRS
jgi:hypothetical protein